MRLIRIIDRYVFSEALKMYVLGFFGFLGFLMINKLFLEAEKILDPTRPGWAIVKITLLNAPYDANWSIPVAMLFATLMSMSRLAKDNELTAMFTNGISLYRLFLPYLVLSSVSVLGAYVIQEYVVTAAAAKQQEIYAANPGARSDVTIENDPYITKLPDGTFISAERFDKQTGGLSRVIYDDWGVSDGQQLVIAEYGRTNAEDLNLGLNASSPAIIFEEMVGEAKLYEYYRTEPIFNVNLGLDLKEQEEQIRTPQELTQQELAEQSQRKKQLGENTAEDDTDYHLKFSGAFASLAFALVAMPLSLRAPRQERLLNLVFCFILIFIYYTIYFIAKLMGYNGLLEPWLAAWLMNIVFAGVALMIFAWSRK